MRGVMVQAAEFFRRQAWLGWSGWAALCIVALVRVHPRRYASTFNAYLEAAERLHSHAQVYDPHKLGEFLYLPVSLLMLAPFTALDPNIAADIWLLAFAAILTWGCYSLVVSLWPGSGKLSPFWIAGLVLLINVPAAWFNFKGVQSQIVMTGGMLLAAAAIARAQWLRATIWLAGAIAFKPLALVMAMMCAVLFPRMRWPLAVAMVVLVALPFAFIDAAYMAEQYRDFVDKLWLIATAPSEQWPYRADISTLLRFFGVPVEREISLALRAVAAPVTLFLAWRVHRTGSLRAVALALVLLSACYINLFSPRNEYLSFLVSTPAVTILGLLLLDRDDCDWRGWLLIVAALVLGMWWNTAVDAVIKPAIVVVLYVWLGWLMIVPERWIRLTGLRGHDA